MSHDWIKANHSVIALKQLLAESSEYSLQEQIAISTNHALTLANDIAHKGASKEEIHNFLHNHGVAPYEIASAWYRAANGASTHLLNHFVGKVYAPDYSGSHIFKIGDSPVHDHLIQDSLHDFMRVTHNNTTNELMGMKYIPKHLTLYRGVTLHNDTYAPRHLESWTTQHRTAMKFAGTHVLTAKFKLEDVVWHYLHGKDNVFIPPEQELWGKEEHVTLGHRAFDVQMIPKAEFKG